MQIDSQCKIAALGEILWDLFPDERRFGGAPANFASHFAALGGNVALVSSVGHDELGDAAMAKLDEAGIGLQHVSRLSERSTGAVRVTLDASGNASYEFGVDEAWDHIPWDGALEGLAHEVDLVYFGSLAQRSSTSRGTLRKFLAATDTSCLRLLDLNLRPPYFSDRLIADSLELANVLKVNDDELAKLAELFALDGQGASTDPEAEQVQQLADRFGLAVVAVTSGRRGGLIYRDGHFDRCAARSVDVEDTVGAGDSFTAALALGLLRGMPIDAINNAACRIAEFVCTQPGPTPKLPPELLQLWK